MRENGYALALFSLFFFNNIQAATLNDAPIKKQETPLQLAKNAQDVITKITSVPIQITSNFQSGPFHKAAYQLEAQPVMRFALNPAWDLFFRSVLPFQTAPSTTQSTVSNVGLGDYNPFLLFGPTQHPHTLKWAIGPTFLFPTASNASLGAGKWSVGPAAVVVASPDKWLLGFLTYNLWSVAGVSGRPTYNQFTFEYFVNYNFSNGWYLTTFPTVTANWQASTQNCWTLPLGGGVGRAFYVGKQALNFSLQSYYNIKRPHTGSETWSLQFTLMWLFPK